MARNSARLLVLRRNIQNCQFKELFDEAHEFESCVKIERRFGHSLTEKEFVELLFDDNNCPIKMAEADALLDTAASDLAVFALDVGFGFVDEPIAQVLVNLAAALFHFLPRNLTEVTAFVRCFKLAHEVMRQGFGVAFDESHQTESNHNGLPVELLIQF